LYNVDHRRVFHAEAEDCFKLFSSQSERRCFPLARLPVLRRARKAFPCVPGAAAFPQIIRMAQLEKENGRPRWKIHHVM